MKEAVIFPDPQDVNIIATRNGELTQIPGTEFRAPIAPYRTQIKASWNSSSKRLELQYSTQVTVKVHGLYQKNEYGFPIPFALPSEDSYIEHTSSRIYNYTYWKEHPDSSSKPSPDSDKLMYVLAEIIGYKTVETIEVDRSNGAKVLLPEINGVVAMLETYNPGWNEDKWDW